MPRDDQIDEHPCFPYSQAVRWGVDGILTDKTNLWIDLRSLLRSKWRQSMTITGMSLTRRTYGFQLIIMT